MKTILVRLYRMLTAKQKMNFVLITLIMVVSAGIAQLLPLCIGELTDQLLTAEDAFSFRKVLPFLIFILCTSVLNEFLKVGRRLMVEDTSTRFEKEARCSAVNALLHARLSYFRENMTGNIHGRLNRSLEGTVKLLKLIFMDFTPAIFNAAAAVIVIFSKLPLLLSSVMLLVVPFGVFIVYRQISTQKGIRVELLEEKSKMDGSMVELLNGMEVIRVCDTVEEENRRFYDKSEYLRKKEMRHHRAMAFYDCLKYVNEAVFTVIIVGGSVYLAGKEMISVGTILTAYLCFTQLTSPLRELHRILDELSEAFVLSSEYFKIRELPEDFSYRISEQEQGDGQIIQSEEDPVEIRIENLTFQYESGGKEILRSFKTDIPAGIFLGIAGHSGCGKSSLIKVLCRLEKSSGVFFNGVSADRISRRKIAELITLVPQTPFLIAGTIRENICYGIKRTVTDEELKRAAERACVSEFVEEYPEKYEFQVAEGGRNLSGGQRQRIALARVFLRRPKILILDEATSALDNLSEKRIQKEIETLRMETGMTIIAIAHRLTTLENCSRILVLENGQIVQNGTFGELTKEPGIFQDMYRGKQ